MTTAPPQAPTTHRVPTSLGTVAVHEHPSSDPAAPPAVLWHSMFADSSSWAAVVPCSRRTAACCWSTGPATARATRCGRSARSPRAPQVAEQLLDRLELPSVDWLGNAWGGHTGLHLAATRPGRVRTLVAVSSPVQPLTSAQLRQVRLLTAVLRRLGPVRPVRDAVAGVQLAQPQGPHRPVVDAALRTASRRSLALSVDSFVTRRSDLSWALPRIEVPTLLVATDDRFDWTPELAEAAAARLPDGRVVVVPGANVLAPLEQPQATADTVLAFWAATAGDGRPAAVGRSAVGRHRVDEQVEEAVDLQVQPDRRGVRPAGVAVEVDDGRPRRPAALRLHDHVRAHRADQRRVGDHRRRRPGRAAAGRACRTRARTCRRRTS